MIDFIVYYAPFIQMAFLFVLIVIAFYNDKRERTKK